MSSVSDSSSIEGNGRASIDVNSWSCGSAQHYDEFPNECIVGGLPVTIKWEGGDQVVDDGRQFI